MSSATNEKRGHLENELQRRMHNAEASPSPDLWARIDHDLTIQESKHYKGRMVLYRQLAAACFVLFMLTGALLTYNYKAGRDTNAAIASMQLGTEAGRAAGEMAMLDKAPTQKVESLIGEQSVVQGIANEQPHEVALQESSTNMSSPNTLNMGSAAVEGINTDNTVDDHEIKSVTAAPGTTENNRSLITVTSKPFATVEDKNIFGVSKENIVGSGSVLSRFDTGRPFFQTARQAIAAVPSSFKSSVTTEQSITTETSRTQSLVELSQAAIAANLAEQKKAEELAIALNTPVASAKKEEKERGRENPWSLGLGYAPSYFNQNIQMPGQMMGTVARTSLLAGGPDKSDKTSENMDQARDEFEANTDPAFSYAAEVKAGIKIFKKIRVLAGVGFSQNTARTKSSYIINQFLYKPGTDERVAMPGSTVFLPSLNNNFTTDSLSVAKTDEFYVNYRYRHITLPLGLQYEGKISKNWFWYTTGEVAANFLVETTVMASNSEVKDVSYGYNDDSPFRKIQFSGNASAGFGKRISNAISVTIGPEFKGYLNSLLSEPDKALAPQGNPYTLGVNMSVNYNLGQK